MGKGIMDKLLEGREFRDIDIAAMEIRALDTPSDTGTKSYIVEGYATRFDNTYSLYDSPDYKVLETVSKTAFDNADLSDVIMQYNHEGRVMARVSNATLTLAVDDFGLHIRADLGGTELGRSLYEEIKGGYTTKMSFGFRVAESERKIIEDEQNGRTTVVRTITKIAKVYDVSAVSLPANNETEISARTFCDGVIAEVKAERLAALELRKRKLQAKLTLMQGGNSNG